jgi:transposase
LAQIAHAKRRFGLPADAPVHSVYEAGRDGFWLHRFLRVHEIQSVVVDASSIEVNRRYRRSKTDRLDMQKLLTMLVRWVLGETQLWKVVRVPSVEDEALRQPHREIIALKEERTQHINRMKGLLAGLGLEAVIDGTFPERLRALRQWDGQPVPVGLQERLLREFARWALVQRQIQDLENAEARMVRDDQQRHVAQVRTLMSVRGIGAQSAWLLVREVFGWRKIQNRRELAALAGLTPTPYHSGQSQREQGISKAGSKRLRWLMVELAWGWLHWQPASQLSRWYQERFGQGSARLRKLGIVALARKLLVALWRLVAHGEIPQGAALADWYRKVTGRCAKRRPVGTAVMV